MDVKKHGYRMGSIKEDFEEIPADPDKLADFEDKARKQIEPWLSAVFQSEHLNLLIGSGCSVAVGRAARSTAAGMGKVKFGSAYDTNIDADAENAAKRMSRGDFNVEDQFRSALAVLEGLRVLDLKNAEALKAQMDEQLHHFLKSVLEGERGIVAANRDRRLHAEALLQSFLLSFASRMASRERLHVFTTNYDRLIEHACDLAGLRVVDRFVGALTPVFRSSRVEVDLHYNPPGIRGEPRFMEGVIRLTKLHGSLDWRYDTVTRTISRVGLPFGADADHSELPRETVDTVMIYPNPAKDIETIAYPYAELFRDMAASLCRPNSVLVTYGYGFGDDHINRILLDMLAIPSTHIVIIAFDVDERLKAFCGKVRQAQVTLLYGPHFGSLENLVDHYLPKPALDYITGRLADLMRRRPGETPAPGPTSEGDETEGAA